MTTQNLYDNLSAKPIEELRDLARKSGLTPHPKAKPETLARQITEKVATPNPQAQQKHPVRVADPLNSEDDVRELLSAWPSVMVQFHGDDTFTMTCRGAVESMHMTSKPKTIRTKAAIISRGALRPVEMDMDGTKIMRAG